jgi:hypothetical protein
MVTGVTIANVARATRGTCTRGRKDARAPGFVVAVSGMNQRIAASTMKAMASAPIRSNVVGTSPEPAGDARVVEQDHLTVASEAIRHRRASIIHGADEVLVENDRHAARLAESAIGETDSASLYELSRRGLVSVLGHGAVLRWISNHLRTTRLV